MRNLCFYVFIFASALTLTSCSECKSERENTDGLHLEMAVLFQQKAPEYKALCYQAFNTAALMLEKDLANPLITQKRALVFDIDETVLDNSPYEAKCALEGISYPEKWNEWCQLAKAKAIPGAVEFINDAHKKGVAIFYISNRKEELFDATKKNLISEGLPLVDDSFLLLRTEGNSKSARRQMVLKNHHISLLFGDNLGDFADDFDDKTAAQRDSLTIVFKNEFGKRFIVLPNPMYGDWEMALYDNNGKLTKEEKAQKRKNNLIGF